MGSNYRRNFAQGNVDKARLYASKLARKKNGQWPPVEETLFRYREKRPRLGMGEGVGRARDQGSRDGCLEKRMNPRR